MNYKIKIHVAWQIYDDILYIFDDKNRESYILEDVSVEIWKLIVNGCSHDDIVSVLSNQYLVDSNIIKNDVDEFIEQLIDCDLLEVIS